jgi:orotidine-5'-phosphate decarboxylase
LPIVTPVDPRVIVALDFAHPSGALALMDRLDPGECALKVGKEMFVVAGPEPVRWMIDRGFRVFLDLKFHDIPNTVAQACAAATRLGVWMLNVHAAGGTAMMDAAREAVASTAAKAGKPGPLLIAVTVLTSLDDADVAAIGMTGTTTEAAQRLALLAQAAGLDGVVCSAQEAAALRQSCGREFKLVTPGIRPAGSARDDQARIITPEQAMANGADYLVIGRPITQAPDPLAALASINASIRTGTGAKR